jgi:hypothetical protein
VNAAPTNTRASRRNANIIMPFPSVQAVETATGRHAASSRSTNACLASMRSTVSLPSGSRVGRFGASTSLKMALASFAGSPRWAWLTLAAWSRVLRRCAHPSGRCPQWGQNRKGSWRAYRVHFAPRSGRESRRAGWSRCAMCGRLRVGKGNLHVALLVGAAMCSACWCGSHDRWP